MHHLHPDAIDALIRASSFHEAKAAQIREIDRRTGSPEGTMRALERKLPREYWIEINRLLVPFGKHICTGHLPKCSACPVLEYCRQAGVTTHR